MKFYSSKLPDLIKKIETGKVKSLLIHGTNQGFAKTAIEHIAKKQNLLVKTIDTKEITAESLSLIANSQNFFAQKELIKITGVTSAFNKKMQDLFTNEDFYNFICFVSNDSLPATGIRKFFESKTDLASLGCYYDDEQTIAKMILQQCQKRDKSIEDEALFYLRSHLKGDHQIIKSELEKLFAFTHDQDSITKDHVIASLSLSLLASGDEMCMFFAQKDANNFLNEVQNLKDQNKNEVLMIRALIRYYMNIYIVALRIESGDNIDFAIKTLSPPIFFKYVKDFRQVASKYSSKNAVFVLHELQQAEVKYKSNASTFDLFETYIKCHSLN